MIKASQRFLNTTPSPIECLFTLPMPNSTVLHNLTITTDDGRVLTAQVEDKDQAKERYSDAISAGSTAVYGEESEKEELRLNIGNLGVGVGLEVAVSLVSPLQCEGNQWLATIPAWLIPDWAQGVMSCSQFAALEVAERHEKLAIDISIVQSSPIVGVFSASNSLSTTLNDTRLHASVQLQSLGEFQDIQMAFQTEETIKPVIRVQKSPLGEYVGALSFIPPLLAADQSIADIEGRGDFVLIIDRSGSMEGASINMAKEAAVFFLKSLSEGSFFNVVSFGSSYSKLFPTSVPVSSPNINQAISLLSTFTADMGGTSILQPLQAVYAESGNSALPRALYLLTDGEVEDREAVISCIGAHSKQVRVHAFGIGSGVDRSLILQAAEAAKGCAEFILDPADIKKKVISVLKKALLPALSGLQVQWSPTGPEQYPGNAFLPVCYFGEIIHVFASFGSKLPSGLANLSGINTVSGENVTFQVSLEGSDAEEGMELSLLWAKAAIKELTAAYHTSKSVDHTRISDLSRKYGVTSEFTAYICVQSNSEAVVGQLQSAYVAMPLARKQSGSSSNSYGGVSYASSMPMSMPMMEEICCCCDAPDTMMMMSACLGDEEDAEMEEDCYDYLESRGSSSSQAISANTPTPSAVPQPSTSALAASLVALVSQQEVSGLWLSTHFPDLLLQCALPEEVAALGEQAKDLWTTLCVLVLLTSKFHQQAEEWEVIARKANRVLKSNKLDPSRYFDLIKAQLGL